MTTRTVAAPIALLAPEGDAAPRVVGFALDAPALAPLPAEALSPFVSSMREWIMDRYPGILSVRNDFGRGRSFWLLADAEAAPDPDELLYHMRAGILLGTWKLPDVREAVRLALAPGAAAMRTTEVAPSDLWPNDRMACAAAIASHRLHTMRLPGVDGGTLHPIPVSTAKGPSQELWLWPPRTIGDGNDARLLVGRVGLKATDSLVPGRIAVVAELRVSTIIDRPVALPAGIGSLHWLAKDAQERLRSIKLHLAPDGETIVDTRVRMLRGVYNGFAVPDFKEFRKDPAAHLDVLKASGLFATASATTQYVTAYTDDGPVGHRTGAVKLKGVTAGEESLLLHALAAHLAPLGFSRCPPSADVAAARLKPLAKLPEPPDSVAPDVQLRTKLPDGFAVCVAHDTLDGEDASRCGPLLEDLRSAVADWSLRVYGTADAIRFVPAPVPGIAEPMPSKSGRADQEAFVSVMREAVEDCLRGVNLPAAIIAMCPFRKVGSSRKEWVRRAAGFGAARPLQCVDPVAYNKPPPAPRGSGQIATKLRARMPRMTAADFAQFKEEVGEYQPERLADLAEEFRAEAHLQRKAHVRAAVLWEVSRQLGVRPALPHPSLMPHDALVVVQVSGVRSGQRSHSREGGAVALAVRWRRGTAGTDLSTPALSAWRDVHERGIGTISGDESNAKILAWLAALAKSPDTKGHLFVLTVADQYLSSRAEQALAGRDIAVVDTSGIRMVGAKPGLLEAGLGYEAYRAAEQDHVRRLCPAGLYPQGGGAFLSVTEAKAQDQGLAKGSATRFLVRLPGLKPVSGAAPKAGGKKPPEARMLRPKGYLIRVSLTGDGDAEAVAAALHGMRRMDIPGGGSNFVSPGGVHYARKLLEWAGYEDKDRTEGLDNEQDKARPGGYLFVGGASE